MNIRKLGLTYTIAILSVTSVLGGCGAPTPQESIRSKAEEVNKIKAELDKIRKEATEDKAALDKVRKLYPYTVKALIGQVYD
ncbi:MAG: hypothetical protein AB3P25_01125 [Candidatus Liberibacter psyllaurous]